MKRRQFTKEFKEEAVRLSREDGRTLREVASSLGISQSVLVKWRGQLESEGQEAFRGNGNRTALEQELWDAKREIRQLRQEQEILKKAAAYFAKHLG